MPSPEELAANSIPIGSNLCHPAQLARPFLPGSSLLLYSDGLVEAVSPEGEPYGYERLERLRGIEALLAPNAPEDTPGGGAAGEGPAER